MFVIKLENQMEECEIQYRLHVKWSITHAETGMIMKKGKSNVILTEHCILHMHVSYDDAERFAKFIGQ